MAIFEARVHLFQGPSFWGPPAVSELGDSPMPEECCNAAEPLAGEIAAKVGGKGGGERENNPSQFKDVHGS